MPSTRTRHTSKSGGSPRSRSKPARSTGTGNSSPTAPVSFEEVFGKGEGPEQARYRALMAAAEERLQQLEKLPMPRNALLRTRHKQKMAKERKAIRDLAELLD